MGSDICVEKISKHLKGECFGGFGDRRIGEFLTELKKEFSSKDNELTKVVELKKVRIGK